VSRSLPLILTAQLPADLQGWAERLRRQHYPPERNRVPAHVTLFHTLPPGAESELRRVIARLAADTPAVPARIGGIMDLGQGTALRIDSPAMLDLRDDIADFCHGLLTAQDQARPVLHVTIQNKVSKQDARALQSELYQSLEVIDFRFAGLALHQYDEGKWIELQQWRFRG